MVRRLAVLDPARAAAGVRSLRALSEAVTGCAACPRLRAWCSRVAREKRAAYRAEEYWGRPVPGFGDPRARILLVGLAPAAHGGNRTGRAFTGDRSGDFLYAALHRAGLANQPRSVARGDGLTLRGAYVAAAVRCAPPANKPAPDELTRCLPFLVREAALLAKLRVVVVLGAFAHAAWLRVLQARGAWLRKAEVPFAHGAAYDLPGQPALLCTYHPSQQNTFTGKLTPAMLDAVLAEAVRRARS